MKTTGSLRLWHMLENQNTWASSAQPGQWFKQQNLSCHWKHSEREKITEHSLYMLLCVLATGKPDLPVHLWIKLSLIFLPFIRRQNVLGTPEPRTFCLCFCNCLSAWTPLSPLLLTLCFEKCFPSDSQSLTDKILSLLLWSKLCLNPSSHLQIEAKSHSLSVPRAGSRN